jgi:hypothetical protein
LINDEKVIEMSESKEENEDLVIEKALKEFYFKKIGQQYGIQVSTNLNRHNVEVVTVLTPNNNVDFLKDLTKNLVIDLVETKIKLWKTKKLKESG